MGAWFNPIQRKFDMKWGEWWIQTLSFSCLTGDLSITAGNTVNLNCLQPSPLHNNTIYVDAQYGNDATGVRENVNRPFQTIMAAYTVALPGDLVYVRPWKYNEQLVLSNLKHLYFEKWAEIENLAWVWITDNWLPVIVTIHWAWTFTWAVVGADVISITWANSNVSIECDTISHPLALSWFGMELSSTCIVKANTINVVNTKIFNPNIGITARCYLDCPRIFSNIITTNGAVVLYNVEIFVTGNLYQANITSTWVNNARTLRFEHNGGILWAANVTWQSWGATVTAFFNWQIRPAYWGLNPWTILNVWVNAFAYNKADVDWRSTTAVVWVGVVWWGNYQGIGTIVNNGIWLNCNNWISVHTWDISSVTNVAVYYNRIWWTVNGTTTGKITGGNDPANSHWLQYDFDFNTIKHTGDITSIIDGIKNNTGWAANVLTTYDWTIESTTTSTFAAVVIKGGVHKANNNLFKTIWLYWPYIALGGLLPVFNSCSFFNNNAWTFFNLFVSAPSANVLFYGTNVSNKPYESPVIPQVNLANGFIVSALVI